MSTRRVIVTYEVEVDGDVDASVVSMLALERGQIVHIDRADDLGPCPCCDEPVWGNQLHTWTDGATSDEHGYGAQIPGWWHDSCLHPWRVQ